MCSLLFPHPQNLRIHTKTHLKCKFCSKEFSNKKTLLTHTRTNHAEEVSKIWILCNFCNDRFQTEVGLKIHKTAVHQDSLTAEFKCGVCSTKYSSQRGCNEHMQYLHHKILNRSESNISGIKVLNDQGVVNSPIAQVPENVENQMKRNFCPENFSISETYNQQVTLNQAGSSINPQVESSFHLANQGAVNYPIAKVPENFENLIKCHFCSKRFSSQKTCNKHMTRIHLESSNNALLKCLVCKKQFSKMQSMNQHIVVSHKNQSRQKEPLFQLITLKETRKPEVVVVVSNQQREKDQPIMKELDSFQSIPLENSEEKMDLSDSPQFLGKT